MNKINVDQLEIEKFDQSAPHWWEPDGEFKVLHIFNPIRLGFIQSRTEVSGKYVLDVGCGGGLLSESLSQAGAQVTGIDMSEAAIAIAKDHAKANQLDIDYQINTIESLAESGKHAFDVITCMELLEHVPSPQAMLHTCASLLKPDGCLFISTINRTLKAYLLDILAAEYLLELLPKGTHEYQRFIKPSEVTQWARETGLQLKALKGMSYNPFNNTARLCESVDTNYIAYFSSEPET